VLEVFTQAPNWRKYCAGHLAPFVRGDVLEVGAGLGASTFGLAALPRRSWTCLEPDRALAAETEREIAKNGHSLKARVVVGTIEDLPRDQRFDAVIYLDVLEHIQDDARELRTASSHLKAGGTIVVLSPAHQWLFSPFDRALGHLRRYDRRSLREIAPAGLVCERLIYLDSISLIVFGLNRLILRQRMPTQRQVQLWDRILVLLSRVLDPLLRYCVGKTVLAVLRRPASPLQEGVPSDNGADPRAGR
jgi:SAM-dependent methyltransferase